jgi:hypothetical protein
MYKEEKERGNLDEERNRRISLTVSTVEEVNSGKEGNRLKE